MALNITGNWVQANAVPMGGGVLQITSKWTFTVDGAATLATASRLEHNGQVVTETATNHSGRWRAEADRFIVELADHEDSPFRLSITDAGELKSGKRGIWRRANP